MELNNNGIGVMRRMGEGEIGARVPVFLCHERASCEIAEDFLLPEYLPEIRRVLRIGAVISRPSRYLAATSLKLSGAVEYNLLYVGADGRVHSTAFTDEYEMNLPFSEDADRDPDCELRVLADVRAGDVICKVTGARKMNVRCRICAEAKVVGDLFARGGADIPSENHVQRLIKSKEYCREMFGENNEMEAIDELELPLGEKYVCSDCRVFVEDATAHEGYAECRGTVIMRHIIEKTDGELYDVVRKIPFNEIVEVDGMTSGMPSVAFGRCGAIVKSENGDDEEKPSITVSAHICLVAKGYCKAQMRYVKDAFSTAYESGNEANSIELPTFFACGNRNLTISETKSVGEAIGVADVSEARVINAIAEAVADGVDLLESGHYAINGKCRFYVLLARGEGEDCEYSSADIEIPFKYECSEGGELPTSYEISLEAVDPRVRIDGDKVDVGCELLIAYSLCGSDTVEYIENVKMGSAIAGKKRGYTVCYPDKNESLWSIAKKYRACVDATARGNGIDASLDADSAALTEDVKYMIV